MSAPQAAPDLELAHFARFVQREIGLDLNAYKTEQLKRRLQMAMTRARAGSLGELARQLEGDPSRLAEFRDQLTINVSEFFRDLDKFRYLEERILPELATSARRPSIWSAGCSNGGEPYSIAMIMADLLPAGSYRVLGTDIDRRCLAQARAGIGYRSADVRNVSPARLARYFRKEGDSYEVVEQIRRSVDFAELNLLADEYPRKLDLIVCRNVVIYFTEEAKDRVFSRMVEALKEGGVLFIGATETLGRAQAPQLKMLAPGFYRRVGA